MDRGITRRDRLLRLVLARASAPRAREVTIAVRACSMNPIDYKNPPSPIGFEVADVIIAAGPGTRHEVGDEVLAFRIEGGYATALTVPDRDAFKGRTYPLREGDALAEPQPVQPSAGR